MNVKYKVTLNDNERSELEKKTSSGKNSARLIKRAQILLMSDQKAHDDQEISDILSVSLSTIYRVKRDFVEFDLESALEERSRAGQPRKLDANEDALLIAIACSNPPQGRCRWTLSLLADQLITLSDIEDISHETIRNRLKANDLKLAKKDVVHG